MISKALAKYVRMSPKKTRLVVDAIRGKNVAESLAVLPNIKKKASEYLEELIRSAVNNAKVKYPEEHYTEDVLFISKITADGGPSLVRFRAASMGRATMIRKRTSHILVELDVDKEKMAHHEDEMAKSKKTVKTKQEAETKKKSKKTVVKGSK